MTYTPFNMDPSQTTAFLELGGSLPFLREVSAVVIGGGTGAPMSIRTLLSLGVKTDAVVAMADDGGSTGRLRESADVTPPGDIRKCIAAMAADPNDPLTRAFKYRFAIADNHALGNLMLAALEDACGSFKEAIAICERLVRARGHVIPSTYDHIKLVAKTRDGEILHGQAAACHSKTALESIKLFPLPIKANPDALAAIETADVVVLGPGSLFTSVLAALQVPGIIEAIARSGAAVVFVCAVADCQGETWGLSALEHVRALAAAGLDGLIDYVIVHAPYGTTEISLGTKAARDAEGGLHMADYATHPRVANTRAQSTAPTRATATRAAATRATAASAIRPVAINYADMHAIQATGPVVVARDLASAAAPAWHDPAALRAAFIDVLGLIGKRRK